MRFKINKRLAGIFFAFFFACAVFCQGCYGPGLPQTEKSVKNRQADSNQQAKLFKNRLPYQKFFGKWTKNGRIYRGLDLELIASATFKSREFRDAYADEYARVYKLSESEKEKLISDQEQAGSDYNEFIIVAYVPEEDENDFSKKKSIWKIYLFADKKERALPVEIRKKYRKNAFTAHFFPCVTTWKSVYIARFPVKFPGTDRPIIDENSENIKLVITGVAGEMELKWTLKKRM